MLYFKFYRGKGQKIKFSALLLMILLSGDYRGKGQKIKFSAVLRGIFANLTKNMVFAAGGVVIVPELYIDF